MDASFLDRLLVPGGGTIELDERGSGILLPLPRVRVPDDLREEVAEDEVDTEIVLEGIALDDLDVSAGTPALAGRSFAFPVDPADGYIEGSVYLGHVHNPVEVTRIAFGEHDGDTIAARIEGTIDFTFEGPEVLGVHPFALDVRLAPAPRRTPGTIGEPSPEAIRELNVAKEEIDAFLFDRWRERGRRGEETLGPAAWRGIAREAVRRHERGDLPLGDAQRTVRRAIRRLRFARDSWSSARYLRRGARPFLRLREGSSAEERAEALDRFWSLHPNR